MARRSWSVQDAKNRFSEVVEAAQVMSDAIPVGVDDREQLLARRLGEGSVADRVVGLAFECPRATFLR